MIKLKFRFALLNGLAGGWLYLVCAAPAQGATLGALQLRSALGERLDASIPVTMVDGENIASNCFQLVAAADDGMTTLRNARLVFDAQSATRGTLQIRSAESLLEPLVALAVRLQCPGESAANFQREYQIMLDPRDSLPASSLAQASTANPPTTAPASARRSRTADTVRDNANDDGTSSSVTPPKRKPRRVQEGAGYSAPLRASGARLNLQAVPPGNVATNRGAMPQLVLRLSEAQLPPSALVPLSPADAAKKRQELAAVTQDQGNQLAQMETRLAELNARILSLQAQLNGASAPAAAALAAGASSNPAAGAASDTPGASVLPGGLAASAAGANASAAASTAHAAPAAVRRHAPPQAPTVVDEGISWWWWLLLPVAVIALLAALFYWRSRRQWRHLADEEELDEGMVQNTIWPEPKLRSATPAPLADGETAHGAAPVIPAVAAATAALAAQDWHGEADVSVVQPDNVSEEAQLLMDHGLPEHAISLLTQEVDQRPNSLALWMKLFEAYRMTGQKEEFQERALGFGMQFASDSLWQQVQQIGRTLDPSNPLYQSVDDPDGSNRADAAAVPHIPEHLIPHDTSAFDPMPALDPDAPLVLEHTLPDVTDASNVMQTNPVTPVNDSIEFVYTSAEEAAASVASTPPGNDVALIGEPLEFDLNPTDLPAGLNAPELVFEELPAASPAAAQPSAAPELEDPFALLLAEAAPITTPEQALAMLDEIAPLPAADEVFDAAPVMDAEDGAETIELAPPALQTDDELDLKPPMPPVAPAEVGWQSNDPAMQKIAAMLEKGETDAAFRALEELLYTGNGEQRQQALKWLERLYPKK